MAKVCFHFPCNKKCNPAIPSKTNLQNKINNKLLEGKFLANLFSHREGCTNVLISHRPNLILQCDWVIYLEKGSIKYQGSPSDMKQQSPLAQFLLKS